MVSTYFHVAPVSAIKWLLTAFHLTVSTMPLLGINHNVLRISWCHWMEGALWGGMLFSWVVSGYSIGICFWYCTTILEFRTHCDTVADFCKPNGPSGKSVCCFLLWCHWQCLCKNMQELLCISKVFMVLMLRLSAAMLLSLTAKTTLLGCCR